MGVLSFHPYWVILGVSRDAGNWIISSEVDSTLSTTVSNPFSAFLS